MLQQPAAPKASNQQLARAKVQKPLGSPRVEERRSGRRDGSAPRPPKKDLAEGKKVPKGPLIASAREKAAIWEREVAHRQTVLERVRKAALGMDYGELQKALQDAVACEAMPPSRAKAVLSKWTAAHQAAAASAAHATQAESHQKALLEARHQARLAAPEASRLALPDGVSSDRRSSRASSQRSFRSNAAHSTTSTLSVASSAQSVASDLQALRELLETEEEQDEAQMQHMQTIRKQASEAAAEAKRQAARDAAEEDRLKQAQEAAERLEQERQARQACDQLAKQQAEDLLDQQQRAQAQRDKDEKLRQQRQDAEQRLKDIEQRTDDSNEPIAGEPPEKEKQEKEEDGKAKDEARLKAEEDAAAQKVRVPAARRARKEEDTAEQKAQRERDEAKRKAREEAAARGEKPPWWAHEVLPWPSTTMVRFLLKFKAGSGLYQKAQRAVDWKRVFVLVEHGSAGTHIGFSDHSLPCLCADRTIGSSIEDVLKAEVKLTEKDQRKAQFLMQNGRMDATKSLPDLQAAGSRRHPVLVATHCETWKTKNPRSGCHDIREREKRYQIAKERFSLGNVGVCFANTAVLTLLASGKRSGIVIHLGNKKTEIVPIYEGSVLRDAVQTSVRDDGFAICGEQATDEFANFGAPLGTARPKAQTRFGEAFKKSFGRVSFHFRNELEACQAYGKKVCEEELPWSVEARNFYDDLTRVMAFMEPFFYSERVLFNPQLKGYQAFAKEEDEDRPKLPFVKYFEPPERGPLDKHHPGLPGLIKRAVEAVDFHVRRPLLKNVVLSGGGSGFRGLRDRLHMELANIFPVEFDVNVEVVPTEVDKHERILPPAYKGAWLLARSPAFRSSWVIKKDEFDNDNTIAQWLHA